MNKILQVANLCHSYRSDGSELNVLQDINLEVNAGSLVAVQGSSGSGKTSLLLACGGMQKPTSGQVSIQKSDLYQMGSAERGRYRAAQMGYLFQTLQLLPYLTALDNARLAKGVAKQTAIDWLTRLGLSDRLTHKPDSLSHGERQRVALARAIAHRPALIVADEPTGNLDPENSKMVFDTLSQFANDGGAVLIASHDPAIQSFADQVLLLESGTLSEAHVST